MAGIEPRKDREWLRRKFRDLERRLGRVEAAPRIDPAIGEGMGRPWLPFPYTRNLPIDDEWPGTTSSTYTVTTQAAGLSQHAHLLCWVVRWVDDATTGDIQIRLYGAPDAVPGTNDEAFFFVGSFTGGGMGVPEPVVVPSSVQFSEPLQVDLRVRRTAGAGMVRAYLAIVYGVGLRDNPYPVLQES